MELIPQEIKNKIPKLYETEDISDKETEEFLYHLKKEEGGWITSNN